MADNSPEWDGTEVEFTITAKFKYKVEAEGYGDANTLERAMEIDLTNADADPVGVLALESDFGGAIEWTSSWRVV